MFNVALCKKRTDKNFKNREISWSDFTNLVNAPIRTSETIAEYMRMTKDEQSNIKDVGGFVGGYLNEGRRKAGNVRFRCMITLDADFADADPTGADLWETVKRKANYACLMYTTHKHTPEKPRFRLIIPLAETVTEEEYEPLARLVASDFGIDCFDDTTYQASRLMFFPSASKDGVFKYELINGTFLDPKKILTRYVDWRDISSWPTSSRMREVRLRKAEKMENPTEKAGIVGQFCRCYDIHSAIERFLPGVYSKVKDDRYTFNGGSTFGGLVVYDNGLLAVSNHATDPASNHRELNAFDLVRVHLFGDDEEGAGLKKSKSYKSMVELAAKDENVRGIIAAEVADDFADDFSNDTAGEIKSRSENIQYELDSNGQIKATIDNVVILLSSLPCFDGVRMNLANGAVEITSVLPWKRENGNWRDSDDAQLRRFIKRGLPKMTDKCVTDGFDCFASEKAYDPMREWLDAVPEWDGVKRLETLFIDALGAVDDLEGYARAVTEKSIVAAVRRVYDPGYKHDTMLILNGKQGIGKSAILSRLGGRFFTDSVMLSDFANKNAGVEKLQGFVIVEIAELSGLNKMESNLLKSVITSVNDRYREAYGRRSSDHLRRCVFFGTTNEEENGYLKDTTGNRRFLDLRVTGENTKFKPWDLSDLYIEQVWAEAKVKAKDKTFSTYLSGDLARVASDLQEQAMIADPKQGLIENYLDTPVPIDWYERTVSERLEYFENEFSEKRDTDECFLRDKISVIEIWCEALGRRRGDLKRMDSVEIIAVLTRIKGWKKGKTVWIESTREARLNGYGKQLVFIREETDAEDLF